MRVWFSIGLILVSSSTGLKDSSGSSCSRDPFFFIEFCLDIRLLRFLLELPIFLFSLFSFFFIHLICFVFEGGSTSVCSTGGSILPLLGSAGRVQV